MAKQKKSKNEIDFKVTATERKELELTLTEIEDIEDELDIVFFEMLTNLGKEKYPKMKVMRKIVEYRKEVKDYNDVVANFVKILMSTARKKKV